MKYTLCPATALADPGCRAFTITHRGAEVDIFIVHHDGGYYAYVNTCPHTGVNLQWLEHQFLDLDNAFIQCSTHDALFEIDNGLCVAGPCVDKRLQSLSLAIVAGNLVVELAENFRCQYHAT